MAVKLSGIMRRSLIAVFLSTASPALPQLVAPELKTITTRDGLSDDHVWALAKDQRSNLWIGTKNGLNRYDGRRITVFRAEGRANSLPGDYITALATDTGRTLYVGTNAPFLTLFDVLEDTLINIPLPDPEFSRHGEQRITCMRMDRHHRLWIGHGARCLSLFDPITRTFSTTEIPPPLPTSRTREVITFIDEDADGALWISPFRGLVRFDPAKGIPENINLHAPSGEKLLAKVFHVRGIVDEDSTLVFGTWSEGIFRMRKRDGRLKQLWPSRDHVPTMVDHMVTNMCRMPDDKAMVATIDQGLLQLDLHTGEVMHFDRSLREQDAREGEDLFPGCYRLLALPEALVMGSTLQGVAIWPTQNRAVQPIQLPPHPATETIDMVVGATHMGGAVQVLSQRRGLFTFDLTGRLLHHAAAEYHPDQRFESMSTRGNGALLLGATPRSMEANTGETQLRTVTSAPQGTPCAEAAQWVREDGKGGYWYMPEEHGLHHWDAATGKCTPIKEEHPEVAALLSDWPWDVFVDRRGRSWFLSANSPPVVLWPDGRVERVTGPPELAPFEVSDIAEAPDGRLWLAVKHRGLALVEPSEDDTVRAMDISNELPSRNIVEVVAMADGSLWMSQTSTVMHWNPLTGAKRVLSVLDGIAPAPLNLDPSHTPAQYPLLVGTWEGFYMIHEEVLGHASPPHVQVHTVLVGDSVLARQADLVGSLSITGRPDRLTFLLRSDNLIDPQRDELTYRMVGLDTSWALIGDEERISFNHLGAGIYRFEVKARSNGGPWGAVTSLAFVVPPPFWATWWFRSLVALCVILLAWGLFRGLLHRRLRKEREQLERERALIGERMRIAHDLHDDLGSSLASIGMESELAEMAANDPAARDALRRVGQGARNVGDNMRRIVWALSSGQDTLGDLVAYVRGVAGELIDATDAELETEQRIRTPEHELTVDQRKHLTLFCKEALHNAAKHADASKVLLRFEQDGALLRVRISDNGRGFDPDTLPGTGTGSNSMRERASALKAVMSVDSIPGKGTTIALDMPLAGL